MSLIIATLLEKPANRLTAASKYTVCNGVVYLGLGLLLILWPGAVQMLLRDRAFVGDEEGLMRVIGLAVALVGWLMVIGGRTGGRQAVAASVLDRLTVVPLVLLPLAIAGVFPHFLVAVVMLDMGLAIGSWVLLREDFAPRQSRHGDIAATPRL